MKSHRKRKEGGSPKEIGINREIGISKEIKIAPNRTTVVVADVDVDVDLIRVGNAMRNVNPSPV